MSRGFTLIEVLIATALAAIVAIILGQIFIQNNIVFYKESAQIDQGMSLNDSLDEVENDIKSASAVAASYPSPSPTVTTGSNALVLELPSIDSSGNVIDSTFDFMTIASDSKLSHILREKVFPTSPSTRASTNKVLSTDLSQIQFTYTDDSGNSVTPTLASRIGVTITLSTNVGTGQEQSQASATINLRNE